MSYLSDWKDWEEGAARAEAAQALETKYRIVYADGWRGFERNYESVLRILRGKIRWRDDPSRRPVEVIHA